MRLLRNSPHHQFVPVRLLKIALGLAAVVTGFAQKFPRRWSYRPSRVFRPYSTRPWDRILTRLYEDKAPVAVKNFTAPATGTKATLDKKGDEDLETFVARFPIDPGRAR
jgi:hypothetical protein